jgi:predicted HicB family RNase H-like nuclease
MSDLMEHKGYFGSVQYSDEDKTFHGRLEFIRALVTYEGTDVDSLRQSFEESVNDYLLLCKEQESTPEKPFRGTFNVRPGAELHRRAALYAREKKINLNQLVSEALKNFLPST